MVVELTTTCALNALKKIQIFVIFATREKFAPLA
jgi:hypothetical protein